MVTRRVAGVTTREVAPFSFQSLYALTRQKDEISHDPYDMVRWPIVRRGRTAYVRDRFQTRNLPLDDVMMPLSRAMAGVSIALVTHCLDDGGFCAFTFEKGRCRGKWMEEKWREPFWERAARERKISVDDASEDDDAEVRAESLMRDEAVRIATGTDRRYNWDSGRVYRDLWDERANMMRDLAKAMKEMDE